MTGSFDFDPYNIIKDYINKKREEKELNKLKDKHFMIKTSGGNISGKLLYFNKLGKELILVVESQGKQVQVPFDSIQSLEGISSEEYEFPKKLDRLLEISKSRDEKRSTYLSWLIKSAIPVRDSATEWFEYEMKQMREQIEILMLLFPHRNYHELKDEANKIEEEFKKSIDELNQVIALIEQKKATSISDVYQKLPNNKQPDISKALLGIILSADKLESLIRKVEEIILNIKDTVTITGILRMGRQRSQIQE